MVLISMQFWYSTRLKRMSGNKYQRCILALYGHDPGKLLVRCTHFLANTSQLSVRAHFHYLISDG